DVASASRARLVGREPAPSSNLACHAVTWSKRSWPALAAAPVRPVRTASTPSSGPSLRVPEGMDMERAYIRQCSMAVELEHSLSTAKPIDESFATILHLERVVPCVEG